MHANKKEFIMIFQQVNQIRLSIIFIAFSINFLTSYKIEATLLPNVFINEIHYDNVGGDQNEFIELAGSASIDLFGWSLHFYNGSNGEKYKTFTIFESTVLTDEVNGFGFSGFNISGIQNGSPDGIALADADQNIIQFISYEGFFTANDGIAEGITSSDIGVEELSNSPLGYSLQLNGMGNKYGDFMWEPTQVQSFNNINNSQVFVRTGSEPIPINEPSSYWVFILALALLSSRLIITCKKKIENLKVISER